LCKRMGITFPYLIERTVICLVVLRRRHKRSVMSWGWSRNEMFYVVYFHMNVKLWFTPYSIVMLNIKPGAAIDHLTTQSSVSTTGY
jgi:hypothetical protein